MFPKAVVLWVFSLLLAHAAAGQVPLLGDDLQGLIDGLSPDYPQAIYITPGNHFPPAPINLRGKHLRIYGDGRSSRLVFRGSQFADQICIDATNAEYCVLENFYVRTSGDVLVRTLLVFSRTAPDEGCGNNSVRNVTFEANCTLAPVVQIASEGNHWLDCRFLVGVRSTGQAAFIAAHDNLFELVSPFRAPSPDPAAEELGPPLLIAGGSNWTHLWTNCEFLNYAEQPNRVGLWLAGHTMRATVASCLFSVRDGQPGRAGLLVGHPDYPERMCQLVAVRDCDFETESAEHAVELVDGEKVLVADCELRSRTAQIAGHGELRVTGNRYVSTTAYHGPNVAVVDRRQGDLP